MKDVLGGKIEVFTPALMWPDEVWVRVFDGPDVCTAMLSPKKARKFAAKLIAAADAIESADAERAADGLV